MMNNQQVETKGLNHFYAKVYGIFAFGLGISALSAFLAGGIFLDSTIRFLQSFPLGLTGIWLVQIVLVLLLSAKARKNASLTLASFIVYSLLNGLVLSVTLMAYGMENAAKAFVVATITFVTMSLVGVFTKRDLSGIGRAGMGLLIGVIIATLLNLFLKSAGIDYLLSYITVVIFIGLTAYDNQRIRQLYFSTLGEDNLGIAAFMALQLYLDFINLFLSFLRIFSRD